MKINVLLGPSLAQSKPRARSTTVGSFGKQMVLENINQLKIRKHAAQLFAYEFFIEICNFYE